MKRTVRSESWQSQTQRVSLNPSPDSIDFNQDDDRRRSTIGSVNCPIGNKGRTAAAESVAAAPIGRTELSIAFARSGAAQRMTTTTTTKRQSESDVKNNKASTKQQDVDPVLPHCETRPNGEGVFAAKILPQQQQQQQRRQSLQPAVSSTRVNCTLANNGRVGHKPAQEGASGCCSASRRQATRTSWQMKDQQRAKRQQQQQQQFVGDDEKHPLDAASLISKLFFG